MGRLRFAALLCGVIGVFWTASTARAVEFARLDEKNWDSFVPQGKEVDAIYGDFVLRNERIVAVVAQPLKTRNANMTVRAVGGYLIDLTERAAPNDQLSALFPGGGRYEYVDSKRTRLIVDGVEVPEVTGAGGGSISLESEALPISGKPLVRLRYTLAEDVPYLLVESIYSNPTDQPVEEELNDAIRADRTFSFGIVPEENFFWAADDWFRQTYGVLYDGYNLEISGDRAKVVRLKRDGNAKLVLQPGESHTVSRKVFPASSLLAARGLAKTISGQEAKPVMLTVVDTTGPVPQARVTATQNGEVYASGRTDAQGNLRFNLPSGSYLFDVESIDGRRTSYSRGAGARDEQTIELPPPSIVAATITDAAGKPIPAKVSFTGKNGAKDPNWGPETGEVAVKNVYYTHTGSFRQPIAPGEYDVIVSYGPEHDAVFTSLTVPEGKAAELKATLVRSVNTKGWISADFHNHSSPSGDNTSSQFGRVLNILCEQVEFAPCTEHNRIDTYVPHLKRLKVEHLIATCTGLELTGGPLPVNHQNAFPLVHKPHTQDGGAPVTDVDPVVQVERLALWDGNSDKLVQMNHPNLPQILGDRNEDGKPDAGFEKMFGFVDVIEVHPPHGIFSPPEKEASGKLARNPIFHWMQMLNVGYRHTGVVNTDSHYNFHESGFFRNFIKSPTDDPAKIDAMEMVHQAEHGHVVVSTGPFLKVTATATKDGIEQSVLPGDDLVAPNGNAQLQVQVQCPNWLDINRVQVFVNGQPLPELNFTRRTTPERFKDATVRFDAMLPLVLKTDAHVIVATIGEGLTLGPVMGPNYGGKLPPCAVANPIFVDIDGNGFTPNRDLLGVPLPIDPTKPLSLGSHRHKH